MLLSLSLPAGWLLPPLAPCHEEPSCTSSDDAPSELMEAAENGSRIPTVVFSGRRTSPSRALLVAVVLYGFIDNDASDDDATDIES
jgi:hypothetical protein